MLPLFLVFSVAADSSVSPAGQKRFSGKISKERKRRRRPTTAITDPRRHMFKALSLLWKSCGNTSIKTMSMNCFGTLDTMWGAFIATYKLYSTERSKAWVWRKNLAARSLAAEKNPRKENPRKSPRAPPNSLISESSG